MGAVFHPECVRWHACNQPISDYEFSCLGIILITKLASRSIITRNVMYASTLELPFWSQKRCPFREHDGTPRCCSCEQMEPWDTRYIALDDARKLCLECLDSSIMDTSQCEPLYYDIQEFYEGRNMKVDQSSSASGREASTE